MQSDNGKYYVGKVPIPEITAIDDGNSVRTLCERPVDVSLYYGGGDYRYDIGTYIIKCHITDGTHKVDFSYDLVITNEKQTGYVYPQQTNDGFEIIPYWVDSHTEKYCNDQLNTKQMLAIFNYLDKYEILDLDWNGLSSESVYSVDLKK